MKKFGLFLTALLWTALSASAQPAISPHLKPTELRMYGEDAPVTLYVFTSYSCPHCAVFHKEIWPALEKEFIETKQVQAFMVEMPYEARSMTGTLLARCLPPKNYDKFSGVLFENQDALYASQNPKQVLTGYAKLLGMTDEQINMCLADKELHRAVINQRDNLSTLYKVTGMPSVVVVKGNQNKLMAGADKTAILKGIRSFINQDKTP